jgi:hypothetical protein
MKPKEPHDPTAAPAPPSGPLTNLVDDKLNRSFADQIAEELKRKVKSVPVPTRATLAARTSYFAPRLTTQKQLGTLRSQVPLSASSRLSTFDAKIKSLSVRPLILCVQTVSRTLPHARKISG